MSLLSKFFGDKTPPPQARCDDTLAHPQTRTVQLHARKGDWERVRTMIAAETDVTLRDRYITTAADVENAQHWIDEWVAAMSYSADAWLVKGINSVYRAWKIRGSAKADETSPDRWNPFHELVQTGADELFKAIDLAPHDPLPWKHLQAPMKALGAPLDDRLAAFEESKRRAPAYHGCYTVIVDSMTEKWGGSHELMFDLAREAAANAPAQSAVAGALPYAHVERWLYISNWENDPKAAVAYFKRPSVREEIFAAHAKCQDAPASAMPFVTGMFSFCFYLAGEKKAAKEEFRKAKGIYSGLPWLYLGEKAYAEALQEVW
ncbi:MAG: DUF4034 domain-containing protein [Thermoanaerobaculia bacterium]